MVGFLIGANGSNTKDLSDKYNVGIKFINDYNMRGIKREETVCVNLFF